MSLARHTDTIVAPITAVGGAVAVVRVSGADAWKIAAQVFKDWPDEPVSHRAVYGRFTTGDDGLALPFAEGRSYTGEQAVELSVHGSPASVDELVLVCVGAGARTAEPGEFTLRAFMNGRIDLTQAEGVRDTVEAQTSRQLAMANLLRDGVLRDEVRALRHEVDGVLTAVEASTDFSEEIGDLDRDKAKERLQSVHKSVSRLLESAGQARLVREGVTVAIVGLPNAGKSSLLNAVLGSDRAIVTATPGTTRDTLEERLDLDGLFVRLIDTAGLRESLDEAETLGVQRAHQAIDCADLVWYVFDAQQGWTDQDEAGFCSFDCAAVVVANKCDLAVSQRGVSVSAKNGTGVAELLRETRAQFEGLDSASLVNKRHAPVLAEANAAIERVIETLSQPVPDDLAAVDLRAASRLLGEVTGECTPPDVIERIFHDFCIGK